MKKSQVISENTARLGYANIDCNGNWFISPLARVKEVPLDFTGLCCTNYVKETSVIK